jgi:hypothetical protein
MVQQFVQGLVDSNIQEKVLAQASDGNEIALKDLIA